MHLLVISCGLFLFFESYEKVVTLCIREYRFCSRLTFLIGDLSYRSCVTRASYISHSRFLDLGEREEESEEEEKRMVNESIEKRGGWLPAGTGRKAREKREIMSSAFAQPLTGLYESVEYIHTTRWKLTGNTLSSYVTLLRHFVAREWYLRAIERRVAVSFRFLNRRDVYLRHKFSTYIQVVSESLRI